MGLKEDEDIQRLRKKRVGGKSKEEQDKRRREAHCIGSRVS